ncbi:MAG: barstar family protein [Anaerolineales bacterium]|nr:barstar family protein [Anaerolineales bacterium]
MNDLIINLKEVNNKEELHSLLSSKLSFPDWSGKNWDAFWDLITDTELVKMPDRLTIIGFKELSEKLPIDAQLLQRCLFDIKEKYPSIACEIIYS